MSRIAADLSVEELEHIAVRLRMITGDQPFRMQLLSHEILTELSKSSCKKGLKSRRHSATFIGEALDRICDELALLRNDFETGYYYWTDGETPEFQAEFW